MPIILMSNYTHPMQDEYNQKVSKILNKYKNSSVELNTFIRVLGQNQIKFFSKDDVTKFSKLCNPFDKLNPTEALIHLELIYVHVALQVKYFIVKFTGKLFKALNLKPIQIKKGADLHAIEICIMDFKNRMIKLHGRENFWFRALGGIAGTNEIKRQLFQKKIARIFVNTCHSNCVHRFLTYITDSNPQSDIIWQNFRKKISLKTTPMFELNIQSPADGTISPSRSTDKLKNINQNCLRITTFQLNDQKTNDLINPENFKGEGQNLSALQERPRRRLKTLHDRPKITATQSMNLQCSLGPLVEEIIHAKNNRYKVYSPQKKCKTSLQNY